MQADGFREQFTAIADAWALAQGIVDTSASRYLCSTKTCG